MHAWQQSLLIFLGAGVGGIARYWLALAIDTWARQPVLGLPWGTIGVNIIGSFLIGLAFGTLKHDAVKLLCVTGLLGGFTTFSAFSLQTYQLWSKGSWAFALSNVAASVLLCVIGTAAGLWLSGSHSQS